MASISSNGANGHHKFTLTVNETSVSATNNTSYISFNFTISSLGGGWNWEMWGANIKFDVTVNGVKYSGSIASYDGYSNITLKSGALTVAHNADGNKTISFSFSVTDTSGQSYTCGNASASGSMVLTTINQNLSISSLTVSNITETSVVVNWRTNEPRSSTYYSFDNGATWIGSATHGEYLATDGKSGTFNILNLTANKTHNMKVKFKSSKSSLWTESSVISFTTYNYPHCIKSPDFTIGDPLTLDFYNPLGREITVRGLAVSADQYDTRQIFAGKTTGKSLTGFNVDDENGGATVQYNSISNARSGEYVVTVTWNGITMERAEVGVYKIRGDEIPTINAFDYYDGNNAVVSITGDNKQIVQNKSTLQARFGSATANYGASGITGYTLECNGISKNSNGAGTYDFGTIDSARDVELKLTAYDSRGLSASKIITVKMVAYETPKATVDLQRLNNYEDETYLTVDGTVSSVLGKNTMTIQYRYRLSGGSYGSFTTIGDKVKQTLSLDKGNEYIFNVVVTDIFGAKFDKEYSLGKGVFPLFIDTAKNSVGVNTLPKKEKSFEASGLLITNVRETKQAERGQTVEIVLDLNGGANGTALLNFRIMGADLEIARLYYAFRSTQYFGVATPISEISFNNTASAVPCVVENTVAGLKFKITNNHSSTITIRYSIIELC